MLLRRVEDEWPVLCKRLRDETMVSSSRQPFPMGGEENASITRSSLYSGRNGSTLSNAAKDCLGKLKSLYQLPHFACYSADSPTTTLSIGGNAMSVSGRLAVDKVPETIFRVEAWSTASDSTMQTSALGRIFDSELDGFACPSSKGTKRKRAAATRAVGKGVRASLDNLENDGNSDEENPAGIVLYLGAKGASNSVNLTSDIGATFGMQLNRLNSDSTVNLGLSRGIGQNPASTSDTEFDFDRGKRVCEEGSASEDRETLLQLGQTVGWNSRFADGFTVGRTSVSTFGKADVDLGLVLAGNSSEVVSYEITFDGVPVVDEGSSSARMFKTGGGFMPALLMGSPINNITYSSTPVPSPRNLVAPSYRHPEELPSDEDLSMRVRASASGGTTSTSAGSVLSDRASKVCKFRGCSKGARGASGLCIAHGGGQRCEKNGCNKGAEGRTVYCKAHGGGRRCQNLGCTKSAEGKTDYCIGHGGGRRCSHEGCDKAARGRSGLCIRHGGGKRCLSDGCTKSAEGYSGLCISHGGGRRCHFSGCSKGAQGSTMFCKAHGGGKRCMIQGCNKGAEGSTPLCKGHGGGKRCTYDGGGICTKSVHGGTQFCVAHGGGKRCQVEGCSKSARGRTDFCVRHGGGKRCKVEACGKSAQGSTEFCKAHGGGKRCQWGVEGSGFGEPGNGEVCDKFARGKTGLCAAHSAQIQDRRVHGGTGFGLGLTPGLFRGLVSGSGQSRLTMGTPSVGLRGVYSSGSSGSSSAPANYKDMDDVSTVGKAVCTGLVEDLFSTAISEKGPQDMPRNASIITDVLLGNSKSLSVEIGVNHMSDSSLGVEQEKNVSRLAIPVLPANFSIGQSLIPPQVLVPLNMQSLDTVSSRINNWRPPRPPAFQALSADGHGCLARFSCSGVSNESGHGCAALYEGTANGATTLPEGRVHGGGMMACRRIGSSLEEL